MANPCFEICSTTKQITVWLRKKALRFLPREFFIAWAWNEWEKVSYTFDNSVNSFQVYTETLNSRNLNVEKTSQNDIMGFVNDKIMFRQLENRWSEMSKCLFLSFLVKNASFIYWITQPSVSASKCLKTFLYEPDRDKLVI